MKAYFVHRLAFVDIINKWNMLRKSFMSNSDWKKAHPFTLKKVLL